MPLTVFNTPRRLVRVCVFVWVFALLMEIKILRPERARLCDETDVGGPLKNTVVASLMLELTSLAFGFTLPHGRIAVASPRVPAVVADIATISAIPLEYLTLPALFGGAAFVLDQARTKPSGVADGSSAAARADAAVLENVVEDFPSLSGVVQPVQSSLYHT